jgi:hypothetical protein
MSTDERDRIHGRLMRERGEARRELAALKAKLSQAVR